MRKTKGIVVQVSFLDEERVQPGWINGHCMIGWYYGSWNTFRMSKFLKSDKKIELMKEKIRKLCFLKGIKVWNSAKGLWYSHIIYFTKEYTFYDFVKDFDLFYREEKHGWYKTGNTWLTEGKLDGIKT